MRRDLLLHGDGAGSSLPNQSLISPQVSPQTAAPAICSPAYASHFPTFLQSPHFLLRFLDSTASPTAEARIDSGVTSTMTSPESAVTMASSQMMVVVVPSTTRALMERMAVFPFRVVETELHTTPETQAATSVEAVVLVVMTAAPDLEVRVLLDTLTSLETSLARMVTPKTAAKQATVKTDPTTTAAFMLLTEPSTLESCPLREDMVDLLSASMIVVWCTCWFFVFVRGCVRNSE
mmetsp:Transcript_7716/g.26557  ORF Transcript_7716/g.26557 Transcript_7716/m.26557 type:complete len:235 (+) Transcript_7716:44-748(+)